MHFFHKSFEFENESQSMHDFTNVRETKTSPVNIYMNAKVAASRLGYL